MKRFDAESIKARMLKRMQKQLDDGKKEDKERSNLETARDYFGEFEGVNAPICVDLEKPKDYISSSVEGDLLSIVEIFADGLAEIHRYAEDNIFNSKWPSSKCITAPFDYPSRKGPIYI